MDLNKDNKNIYTINSENYTGYMQENKKKPKDLLNSVIKVLLFILLLVVSYFFYKILKPNFSFFEIFNKKELVSTDEEFENVDGYIKELVVTIPTKVEEPKKEKIAQSVAIEVLKNKEISGETTLSENYLDLMVEELNSL